MLELNGDMYNWLKAFHVIFMITWMAGILYLPRLFVYHSEAEKGSDKSETFKIMERRLVRGIIIPSLLLMIIFGGLLFWSLGRDVWLEGWMIIKLVLVCVLIVFQILLIRWFKLFQVDKNTKSGKFYRWVNEVPAVLMIFIVILVIVKPD